MTDKANEQKVNWEANVYDQSMSFVSQYGEDLVRWLQPKSGENIIDFGCGTGDLAAQIATYGSEVIGVDISPEMVERARMKYPTLRFECADGMQWRSEQSYDAVFSNAALHWMKDPESAISSMIRGLRPGGRLVVEFGGYRNVATIIEAVQETMHRNGRDEAFVMPWYFPTIGEYAKLLEVYGMEVRSANLFERPTRLENGEEGMKGWLEMFGTAMFPQASESEVRQWMSEAVENLKQTPLYDNGLWTADYWRLRVVAVKR
ncbi:class I SAM-dependent methyltransferase [Cohnella mopanensis]|uniref:class I SAM-dependent methyltransferase n=1 Tax=Cohnella mopanensis TaxID=2911966 RepID=UPI001EF8D7EE|nr:class I SAM-dependent methyltransferase [Cohnella mopanensis]